MAKNQIAWTEAEEAFLYDCCCRGLNDAQTVKAFAAKGIPRTYKSIQRHRQIMKWTPRVVEVSSKPLLTEPLFVEGDALVTFDWHIPYHDADFINRLIDLALGLGVEQIVIGGDLVSLEAFSSYWLADNERPDAEAEIEAAERILSSLLKAFGKVYYSMGNHEMRICNLLPKELRTRTVAKLWTPQQVYLSDYHWTKLDSGDMTYQIEHPKNASIHAILVPKKLCAKYGCSIIAGHGHMWGVSKDDSGRYWAVDAGICADPQRLAYSQKQHTTRPVMMQGAVIVKDGLPYLLSPEYVVRKVFAF